MTVDTGIYYLAIVLLAMSLVANIILSGLMVRWMRYAKQYKGLWKEASTRIIPYDPYEKQQKAIQYEYLEGLD